MGGPNVFFRRLSSLLSMMSWIMFALVCALNAVWIEDQVFLLRFSSTCLM